MSSLAETYLTPEQYLEREHQSTSKHEYFNGNIFDMAGSTPRHNAITVNITSALHMKVRGRCRVFASDVRIKVPATTLYTYPDVSVVCGAVQYDESDANTVSNPKVIVEVLSQSTEGYDRGDKFAHYQRLDSLTDYLLVSQGTTRVEHYVRQADHQWLLTVLGNLDESVDLNSIGCQLPLKVIYEYIDLSVSEEGPL
jgi:Uma2 family endonuclease